MHRLERIEPSLEDAFVAIIEGSSARRMSTPTQPTARRRRRACPGAPSAPSCGASSSTCCATAAACILTFLYPISMLIMYGYGIRYDVDNVPLTILDYDETPESRDLVAADDPLGLLPAWCAGRATEREVDRDLTTDTSTAAVIIPCEFADRIRAGEPTTVQALIDGSDSNTATIAQGYLLAMIVPLRRRARCTHRRL